MTRDSISRHRCAHALALPVCLVTGLATSAAAQVVNPPLDRYEITDTLRNEVAVGGFTALFLDVTGDYDEEENPRGTRTIAGLEGGDTAAPNNETIRTRAVVDIMDDTEPDEFPIAGGFDLYVSDDEETIGIANLAMTLIPAGETAGLLLGAEITDGSFRTFEPDGVVDQSEFANSLTFGGAETMSFSIVQATGMVSGDAEPFGPGNLRAELTLMVTLEFQADIVLGEGTPIEASIGFPMALPITVEVLEGGFVDITVNTDTMAMAEPVAFLETPFFFVVGPGFGGLAWVDLVAGWEGGLISVALDAVARGEIAQAPCILDFDNNGVLNLSDVLGFLSAYSANDPSADFNRNGTSDIFDVLLFIGAFSAGCD